MTQKFQVNNFEWIEDRRLKKMMKDIFLKSMFSILKNYMKFIMITIFTRKNEN